jgi:hypothetical protein
MSSILSGVWAEWKLLPERLGGRTGVLLYLAGIAILGYMLPAGLGYDFLDPHLILMYACSAPFFVSTVVAESFGGEDAAPRALLVPRIVAGTLFGWLNAVAVLALGIWAVNSGKPEWVFPNTMVLGWALLLGLMLALFTVTLGAALSLSQRDPKQVKSILRRGYTWVLIGLILVARFGLLEWREAFTSLLTADGMQRLALAGNLILAGAAAATLLMVIKHPRYKQDKQ